MFEKGKACTLSLSLYFVISFFTLPEWFNIEVSLISNQLISLLDITASHTVTGTPPALKVKIIVCLHCKMTSCAHHQGVKSMLWFVAGWQQL